MPRQQALVYHLRKLKVHPARKVIKVRRVQVITKVEPQQVRAIPRKELRRKKNLKQKRRELPAKKAVPAERPIKAVLITKVVLHPLARVLLLKRAVQEPAQRVEPLEAELLTMKEAPAEQDPEQRIKAEQEPAALRKVVQAPAEARATKLTVKAELLTMKAEQVVPAVRHIRIAIPMKVL